jgi:hypothetical protein
LAVEPSFDDELLITIMDEKGDFIPPFRQKKSGLLQDGTKGKDSFEHTKKANVLEGKVPVSGSGDSE